MKKIILCCILIAMLVALVSCTSKPENTKSSTTTEQTSQSSSKATSPAPSKLVMENTTWVVEKMIDEDGKVANGADISNGGEVVYNFEKDGLVTLGVQNSSTGAKLSSTQGTYTITGNTVVINVESPATATVEGDTLTYKNSGATVICKKKSN